MDQNEGGETNSESSTTSKSRFVGLYREDVVQSSLRPGLRGMVTKVAGDSDSDTSSDNDDQDDDEAMAEGCARVCWVTSEESTEKIENICVADRAFLHGDIVAAVDAPLGQTGTVVNVDLLVDFELPNGEILKEVDSRKLKRVRAFAVADYVIQDHWLGRVDEVVDNVTVMFDDGSKCKVMRADSGRLVPVPESPIDDSDCPYYPGQRVTASSSLFKGARWLRGSWKPNRLEGVVTDVEVGPVFVYWIAAAHTGYSAQSAAIPSEQQDPKLLKPMTHLSYTNWQLGDRALLPKRHLRKGPSTLSAPAEGSHSEGELDLNLENDACPGPVVDVGSNSLSGSKEQSPDNWVAFRRKLRRRSTKREKKSQRKDEVVDRALLIMNTKTKVDILWQDGTHSYGIDSCTLFPMDHLGNHDFWPEQYVIEGGSDFEGTETETRRVGIVKTVDSKQRTANVRWLRPVERPEEPRQFENEEVVSVYELVEHPDYTYCLGDVVIRLCSASDLLGRAQSFSQLDDSGASGVSSMDEKFELKQEENVEDQKFSGKGRKGRTGGKTKSTDVSWVGVIVGLQDGDIEVAWADGSMSKVGPQAIFVVGRDDDNGSSQSSGIGDTEEGDDAGSWETVDDSGMDELETEEQELEHSDWDRCQKSGDINVQSNGADESFTEGQINSMENGEGEHFSSVTSPHLIGGALSLPLTALFRALRFAAGLLWSLRGSKKNPSTGKITRVSGSQSHTIQKHGLEKLLDESENSFGQQCESMQDLQRHLVERSSSSSRDALRMLDANSIETGEREEAEVSTMQDENGAGSVADTATDSPLEAILSEEQDILSVEHQPGIEPDYVGSFKRFDSVKDPTDHHFLNESGQPSSQRKWVKKIQQEWGILEKNLPDTIYVRVYEDRMDLLRAVIIGAAGTPYQDGLFFFDLYLPPEYPSVPPLAHYHSGGLRLNPNLYETGKVCLSLLNTWTGKGNEVWYPSTSSILQVLVSIQGLVLNAKPYFNEAGYDRQIGTAEGEKNSLAYSENSFLLSCKSMLYLLRRPPKHFEEFVREHFKCQGPSILRACSAYMQGCPVGSFSEDPMVSSIHTSGVQLSSSAGFKLMLAKLIPRLVSAFNEIGANSEECGS